MNKRNSGTFDLETIKQQQQQMAFFKLTFHSPVSKDILCSLCSELMRDSVYTSCCDSYFCQECITRVQSVKRPCPKCYQVKFDIVHDNKSRAMRGKINALRVYCPMSKSGCKWIGPLESLDHHLKYGDATFGSGACQFLAVECPNDCSTHVPRGEIPKHLRDRCNFRKVSCPFCGFTDTHDHMTAVHYTVCALYPVDCPNGCKMPRIQRGEVKDHIENKCPLRTVKCQFSFTGCSSEFKSTDESKHLEEKTSYHLGLLSNYCFELSSENEALRNICYQLQETFANMQSELAVQKSTLKQTQLELWSLKLKLPQPLPNSSQGGEASSPRSRKSQIPPTNRGKLPDRIYSEPCLFPLPNHSDSLNEQGKSSLSSSSGLSSLNEESSKFNPAPRKSTRSTSSEPSSTAKGQTLPAQYDTPRIRTRHKSSPPTSGKPVKPVFSLPIAEAVKSADPPKSVPVRPNVPTKPVKPDVPPKPVVPPRIPQRPIKYANLPIANGKGVANGGGMANGRVTNSNKIGSARTLPASISEELEDVFSTAETPLGSSDEEDGEEIRSS